MYFKPLGRKISRIYPKEAKTVLVHHDWPKLSYLTYGHRVFEFQMKPSIHGTSLWCETLPIPSVSYKLHVIIFIST